MGANPAYHRWPTDWPPIAKSLLTTAERSNAVLVTVSNLYGYGEVSGPMTENLPLAAYGPKGLTRVQMWRDALAAHDAGRCVPPRCAAPTTSDVERRATWVTVSYHDCSPDETSR